LNERNDKIVEEYKNTRRLALAGRESISRKNMKIFELYEDATDIKHAI